MKIEITTSVKAVSVVNSILSEGIYSLRKKPEVRASFKMTEKDLDLAEKLRVRLIKGLLKQAVKKVDEEYKRKKRKRQTSTCQQRRNKKNEEG